MVLPKITPEALRILADYINKVSGIVLDETKGYLAESRLGPLVAELECGDYTGLCRLAKNDANRRIQARIIDAISTNETSFFRDNAPFELFRHKILPDHIDRLNGRPGMLNIWSAACSTGQEVYSIAIALKEILPDFNQWRIRLLGTDISEAAVAQASAGRYNQIEIQRGLPEGKRTSYFSLQNNQWCIKDELRAMATFRQINLHESFAALGKFDIIF
jgi:chemotaxis protein methyltransferase CheR